MSRAEVTHALYVALSGPSGNIRLDEFHQFLELLGRKGAGWNKDVDRTPFKDEYLRTCKAHGCDPKQGLGQAEFSKLISHRRDLAYFCDEDKLQQLLEAQQVFKRRFITSELFDALDNDADGFLSELEMLTFAKCNGFTGGGGKWTKEYKKVCRSLKCDPSKGISRFEFDHLVNDNSEEGCYCTNEELHRMGKAQKVLVRKRLVPALFDALDVWADKSLGSTELRIFAEFSGFSGTSFEWEREYEELCNDAGVDPQMGFNFTQFQTLVNGEGVVGGYLPDKELRELLKKCESERRTKLIGALYEELDLDSDGALIATELYSFAQCSGFAGTPSRWKKEFLRICKEMGVRPDVGMPQDAFSRFVSDQTERGCYCSDHELRQLLAMQCARNHDRLIAAAFRSLDMDDDGALDVAELLVFAQFFGRFTTMLAWNKAYNDICVEASMNPATGVPQPVFQQLVEGDLANGAFFTSADGMKKFLRSLGGSIEDLDQDRKRASKSGVERGDDVEPIDYEGYQSIDPTSVSPLGSIDPTPSLPFGDSDWADEEIVVATVDSSDDEVGW